MMLVNCDMELGLLRSAMEECRAGRARTIVVEGGVGCGKSELLETFAEEAAEHGAVVLRAAGVRTTAEQPFALLRQLVGQLSQWTALTTSAWAGTGQLGGGLVHPVPLGVDQTGADPVQRLTEALHRMTQATTVVICVDDAQDGDRPSLHFLLQAAGRARSARILLVFADSLHLPHRDPMIKTELLRQSNALRIRLGPLDKQGTAAMLAALDPTPRDRALVDALHRITAGNPLLLRALIEECRDTGDTSPQTSSGSPVRLMEGGLYGQAVLACLYRSGPVARELGHALAVLGESATPELVARLVEQPSALIDQNLLALRAAGVIDGSRFRHPAAVATVLADLDPATRTDLHLRAATGLHASGAAPSVIAGHLLVARRAADPWQRIVLRAAAEEALSRDDATRAIACLELALQACGDASLRIEIQLRLCVIMWRTNPAAAEYRYLPGLLEAMRAGALSPSGLATLGRVLVMHGWIEDALELSELRDPTGPDQAGPGDVRPEVASMLVRYGFPGVDLPEDAPQVVDVGEPGGSGPWRVPGIPMLRRSAENLFIDAGEDWVRSAEDFLRVSALTDSTLGPLCSALKALIYADRLSEAAAWCARKREEAQRRNIPGWQALFATIEGYVALRQGRLEDAVAFTRSALEVVPERSGSLLVCGTISILALAYTEMGRLEAAGRLFDQPVPENWVKSLHWLGYLRARGHYNLATNRPHAALSDFLKTAALVGRWGIDHPMMISWRTDAAQAWLRLGEQGQAAQLIAGHVGMRFPEHGRMRGVALRLQGACAPLKERPQLLSRAVEELHRCGDRLELAKALVDLSEAHRELGDPTRADLVRRRAWHIANECGAEPLCRQLAPGSDPTTCGGDFTTEVGLSDTEPRSRLTRAEHRVASLAAFGHTNREISEQLYITVSTVEQHLTRVYQKLRISRRQEIPVDL